MNKVINSEDLTRIIEDYVNREPLDDFEAGYNQALFARMQIGSSMNLGIMLCVGIVVL